MSYNESFRYKWLRTRNYRLTPPLTAQDRRLEFSYRTVDYRMPTFPPPTPSNHHSQKTPLHPQPDPLRPHPPPTQRQAVDYTWRVFSHSLYHNALDEFPKAPERVRKPWITDATIALIEQREQAHQQARISQIATLDKQIKRSARADKRKYLLNNLKEGETHSINTKERWAWVKMLRKGYTAKPIKLTDPSGQPVPLDSQATAFANYLSGSHWGPPPPFTAPSRPPLYPPAPLPLTEFTLKELCDAIYQAKRSKATGPDAIPAELLKELDRLSLNILLELLNLIWTTATVPEDWKLARVVEIFKKQR